MVPRLTLAGADLSRVYFVHEVVEGTGRRAFDPAKDIEGLRETMAAIGGVSLLIVDPIVSAIAGDSHKNAEVRRGLQPLADLAASMNCALLGITHLSKGTAGRDPIERLTGSLAFGALARLIFITARNQEDGSRLFCRAKSNIGPDGGGFAYDMHQGVLPPPHLNVHSSTVGWGAPLEGTARELLAEADAVQEDDGHSSAMQRAKEFLLEYLSKGEATAASVEVAAKAAGHNRSGQGRRYGSGKDSV